MADKRIRQLKFISNIFRLSLKEIEETLGFETLTMIFRRVGESAAQEVVKSFKGKYTTIEEFCNLLMKQVIEPVLEGNHGKISIEGNVVHIQLDSCPYKVSGGYKMQDMKFFCHYTEGLFDNALKLAFPDKTFNIEPKDLISNGCKTCDFYSQIS